MAMLPLPSWILLDVTLPPPPCSDSVPLASNDCSQTCTANSDTLIHWVLLSKMLPLPWQCLSTGGIWLAQTKIRLADDRFTDESVREEWKGEKSNTDQWAGTLK